MGQLLLFPFLMKVLTQFPITQSLPKNTGQSLEEPGFESSLGLWGHHSGFQNERVLSPPAVAVTGLLLTVPAENTGSHFLIVMGAWRGIQALTWGQNFYLCSHCCSPKAQPTASLRWSQLKTLQLAAFAKALFQTGARTDSAFGT